MVSLYGRTDSETTLTKRSSSFATASHQVFHGSVTLDRRRRRDARVGDVARRSSRDARPAAGAARKADGVRQHTARTAVRSTADRCRTNAATRFPVRSSSTATAGAIRVLVHRCRRSSDNYFRCCRGRLLRSTDRTLSDAVVGRNDSVSTMLVGVAAAAVVAAAAEGDVGASTTKRKRSDDLRASKRRCRCNSCCDHC